MSSLERYTEEDICSLLDSVRHIDRIPIVSYLEKQTLVHFAYLYEVAGIFKFEYDEKNISDLVTSDLRNFLFKVPLEEVPLYCNDFPNFAIWRLSIGK